jgi:hypothetical protein
MGKGIAGTKHHRLIRVPSSQFSGLYRGNLDIKDFYTENEISQGGPPFAFFPHGYDGINHAEKDSRFLVSEEADSFKVSHLNYAFCTREYIVFFFPLWNRNVSVIVPVQMGNVAVLMNTILALKPILMCSKTSEISLEQLEMQIYFSEMLTAKQANNFVSYLQVLLNAL